MKDMKFFIIVIGIISLAFGIVSHAALLDYQFEENNDQTDNSTAFSKLFNKPFNKTNGLNETAPFNISELANSFQENLQNIIHNSYWPIFGELRIYDKLECTSDSCPKTWWHKFVFGLLMLYVIAILVLINLLIAMFNSTFEKIHNKTDMIWKYQRFYFIFSYYKYSSAPPPFNIIHRFIMFLRNRSDNNGNGGTGVQRDEDIMSYMQFERQCALEALNKLENMRNIKEDNEEEDEDE